MASSKSHQVVLMDQTLENQNRQLKMIPLPLKSSRRPNTNTSLLQEHALQHHLWQMVRRVTGEGLPLLTFNAFQRYYIRWGREPKQTRCQTQHKFPWMTTDAGPQSASWKSATKPPNCILIFALAWWVRKLAWLLRRVLLLIGGVFPVLATEWITPPNTWVLCIKGGKSQLVLIIWDFFANRFNCRCVDHSPVTVLA